MRRGLTSTMHITNGVQLCSHKEAVVGMRWLGGSPRLVTGSCEKVASGFRNVVLLTDVRNRYDGGDCVFFVCVSFFMCVLLQACVCIVSLACMPFSLPLSLYMYHCMYVTVCMSLYVCHST